MTSKFEAVYLPRRPLASDKKDGFYRRYSRSKALEKPYIEANPKAMKSLIVIDSDHDETIRAINTKVYDEGLPAPLYAVTNVYTGTGHIVYGLKDPVCLTDAGRRAPVNLLARIEHGLNEHFAGDPHYLNSITKNPLSPPSGNFTTDYESRLYSLRELAEPLNRLGALPASNQKKRLILSSVGRNVSLFETTRIWSYSAIRKHWSGVATGDWDKRVFEFAWATNEVEIANEFPAGAMSFNEVTGLARSVSRWVSRKFNPGEFLRKQKFKSDLAAQNRTMLHNQKRGDFLEWAL
jgi:hypothetical protein